ncbi:hypothetical protein SAMN05421823_1138 [Catalinimonas alkaloidigena]|uniref:Uncharacterized protein n=1 Tax=Catalinimonas alkaloidigena TaxID=1075417 RepID=A0A1G9SVE4_9BACT|nr:hypothetical protein [Catalinimonas alkaloidigena]SDM39393.1 hypothetical protein SAMN05421823_1138 [Catalinimonas alkaloidigena]
MIIALLIALLYGYLGYKSKGNPMLWAITGLGLTLAVSFLVGAAFSLVGRWGDPMLALMLVPTAQLASWSIVLLLAPLFFKKKR